MESSQLLSRNRKKISRGTSVIVDDVQCLTKSIVTTPQHKELVTNNGSLKYIAFNKFDFIYDSLYVPLTESVKKVFSKPFHERSELDIALLKPIVVNLEKVHKNFQYVKNALYQVVQLSHLNMGESVITAMGERSCCYFIASGSVEVNYEDQEENNSQPSIHFKSFTYKRDSGEYLGLVSVDGKIDPVPLFIRAIKETYLIKINKMQFFRAVNLEKVKDTTKKFEYLTKSFLNNLSKTELHYLTELIAYEEFLPNKVLLKQNKMPDHLFIIYSGKCSVYRQLSIYGTQVLINCGEVREGNFFGESKILAKSTSIYTYVSSELVKCFILNCSGKNELPLGLKEQLLKHKINYPSDLELIQKSLEYRKWIEYRNLLVTQTMNTPTPIRYKRANSYPSCKKMQDYLLNYDSINRKHQLLPKVHGNKNSGSLVHQFSLPAVFKVERPKSETFSSERDSKTFNFTISDFENSRTESDIVREMKEEHDKYASDYEKSRIEVYDLNTRLINFRRKRELKRTCSLPYTANSECDVEHIKSSNSSIASEVSEQDSTTTADQYINIQKSGENVAIACDPLIATTEMQLELEVGSVFYNEDASQDLEINDGINNNNNNNDNNNNNNNNNNIDNSDNPDNIDDYNDDVTGDGVDNDDVDGDEDGDGDDNSK